MRSRSGHRARYQDGDPRWRHDREILRLALPAFAALVAEPLFLLADSAIVGHLGTPQLAGLGVAGSLLATGVALCVFLAYATTAAVARRVGAGDERAALAQAIDGLWLAALLGVLLGALAALSAHPLVTAFGTSAAATPYATTYLRVSALGVPPMLLVLAATGALRGLQDTRTPMLVAGVGALANIGLNLALVYGAGLGVAGSALGTVLTQAGMAVSLGAVVVRGARRYGVSGRPHLAGIRAAAVVGLPLLVRTLTLRVALLVTTYVAAATGTVAVAAHQVAFTVWTLLALALDAVAIAGQAIVGRYLGAGDVAGARSSTRRMMQWGLAAGVVLGVGVLLVRSLVAPLFTGDPAVRSLLADVLLVVALSQPVNGVVFTLDGVLIGAGDGRYLARAGVVTLVVFLPLAAAVRLADGGLVALWWAFTGFMLARLASLLWRERADRWLVTGAVVPRR
ncbi:MAG: hypothetical protein QOI54_1587 [Actinomycetota bacterium]|nr:hypothetical protein [Actinomycetota bacterium]